MLSDIIDSAVKMFKDRVSNIDKHALTSDSLIEYTRSTRTEPITMIDHTIIKQPELSDLMATLTTIYAAMYSQAFSIAINHEIGSIKALKALDKINPNRSASKAFPGLESHSLTLPDYRNIEKNYKTTNKITMESNLSIKGGARFSHTGDIDVAAKINYNDDADVANAKENDKHGAKVSTDAITKFNQNLSTGILFDVSVTANGASLSVPLSVRLLANAMDPSNVLSILKAAVVNKTAKERYREWRAGGLSFWSDIVLCRDILKEQRKNLIKDQTGVYNEVIKRRSNNKLAGFFSGNPSISNISNILVIDELTTLATFEAETFKKLKDPKVRDTIFNNTNVMILAVVNTDREIVTLYYHSISVPTIVTFRDLKSYNKKQGLDPMEVLRSFQMGGMNGIRL